MEKAKVEKAIWNLTQTISDQLKSNIVQAVTSKQIELDKSTIEKLMSLVAATTNEVYTKSYRNIIASIESTCEKKN